MHTLRKRGNFIGVVFSVIRQRHSAQNVGLQREEKGIGGGESAQWCPNGETDADVLYWRLPPVREIPGKDADKLELVWVGKRVDRRKRFADGHGDKVEENWW